MRGAELISTFQGEGTVEHPPSRRSVVATLLWILAVVLVVAGVVMVVRKQIVMGIVLIVVGLLVGPGGVSVFT